MRDIVLGTEDRSGVDAPRLSRVGRGRWADGAGRRPRGAYRPGHGPRGVSGRRPSRWRSRCAARRPAGPRAAGRGPRYRRQRSTRPAGWRANRCGRPASSASSLRNTRIASSLPAWKGRRTRRSTYSSSSTAATRPRGQAPQPGPVQHVQHLPARRADVPGRHRHHHLGHLPSTHFALPQASCSGDREADRAGGQGWRNTLPPVHHQAGQIGAQGTRRSRSGLQPAQRPNVRWCGDLTEIPPMKGFSTSRRCWTCIPGGASSSPSASIMTRTRRGRRLRGDRGARRVGGRGAVPHRPGW